MKLDQLRKIIREEVRSAVKLELQEVMNEAVKIASNPNTQTVTKHKQIEVNQLEPNRTANKAGKQSLEEMLNQTRKSMTNEEYRTVFNGTSDMVTGMPNMATSMASQMNMSAGNTPGIDISKLDFVAKAGKVFKASNEISSNKIR